MRIYGLDIRSIGIFRIFLGISILYDHIFNKLLLFDELYSKDGLMGVTFIKSQIHNRLLFGFINFSYYGLLFLFFFALLIYTLFTIGYFTRITSLISYILFILISYKYILSMNGADQIVVALFSFALFLPLNRTFSIDKGFLKSIDENIEIKGIAVSSILIQISFIFFFNSLSKHGNDWINGTAIKYTIIDTIFSRNFSFSFYNSSFLSFLTYFTHYFQFLFLFLLFFPLNNSKIRFFLSLMIFVIHWGVYILLDVGYFNIVCSSISVLLLPSHFWSFFTKNGKQKTSTIRLKKPIRLIVVIFLVLIIQRNIFNFLNMTTLSKTKKFQEVYCYFIQINNNSSNYPLISQRWNMFSPNPSHEVGFVTIEGVNKGKKTVNLSQLNPFKNHYKTTTNNIVNKYTYNIRLFYSKNRNINGDKQTKELIKIWEDYERKRIIKHYKINEFSKIEIVFYSCGVEEYSKKGKYNFKRIVIKNLKIKPKSLTSYDI